MFGKKKNPNTLSPDLIRKEKVALIESVTGAVRLAETIGNNDLIDRAIKDFQNGDIDHGLRILRIKTSPDMVEAIASIKHKL